MLIQITRKCNEKCTHCMVNALPDGQHMDMNTFVNAVYFAISIGSPVIHISGGDPFLHPKFFTFINKATDMLKGRKMGIVIESNGWWITDTDMSKKIYNLMNTNSIIALLQISTHKSYYPNYEFTMNHKDDFAKIPRCGFVHDWQDKNLVYSGRAKSIMKDDEIKGFPNCLNLVTHAHFIELTPLLAKNSSYDKLKTLVAFLFTRGKSCAPLVDVDGYIRLAECIECTKIANVNKALDYKKLYNDIVSFVPCNSCKRMKNLSHEQLQAIDNQRQRLNLEPIFVKKFCNESK